MDELWRRNEERRGRAEGRERESQVRFSFCTLRFPVCRVDGPRTLNGKEYDNVLSCLNSSDSWIEVEEMKMALLNNIK